MINISIEDSRMVEIKNHLKYFLAGWNMPIEDLAVLNRVEKATTIEKCLNALRKADRFLFLNELHILGLLDDQECAECVFEIWTMQEKFFKCGMSRSKMLKFMKIATKSQEMLNKIDGLADELTVYRGTKVPNHKGLCWSLDREIAKWFAERDIYCNSKHGYIFSGTLKKRDVIALFEGRNENEIVCDYRKIKNLQCENI